MGFKISFIGCYDLVIYLVLILCMCLNNVFFLVKYIELDVFKIKYK